MRAWSISDLRTAIDRYRAHLRGRGLAESDADAFVATTSRFLAWLDDEPGSAGGAIAQPSAPPSGGNGVSEAVPGALQVLVDRWLAEGRPTQRAAPWPRERWIAEFSEHADFLSKLPRALDRDGVKAAATNAPSDGLAAERAFITVMAWGFGNVGYGPYRTRRALASTPQAAARLQRVAAALFENGVYAAYGLLGSADQARLQGLGPAFGTKFLYFIQPADTSPRALILDETVASWLEEQGIRLNPNVWSVRTYARYLELLHRWAELLAVTPEDVEYVIFREMARRRGTQWAE